jgi:hypothetical protein
MSPFIFLVGVLVGVSLAILAVWIEESRRKPQPPEDPDDGRAVTAEITAGPVREQALDPNEEADR